jgi:large subunit ribosomal protein L23
MLAKSEKTQRLFGFLGNPRLHHHSKFLALLLAKPRSQNNVLVESGFTKTEIKHWVELFFGVKVVAVNSHPLPGKGRRMGPILGHTMHYRRMIITLQLGYSIPLLDRETN